MQNPVSSTFEQYLSVSNLTESTRETKRRAVGRFIDLCGDLDIKDITYANCEDYRKWLCNQTSPSAANTYISNFRPFFGWAIKRGYLRLDPFHGLSLLPVQETETILFSPLDIESLIKTADVRWKVFVLLAAVGGLRRGESQNLKVSDIHFDESYIQVAPAKDSLTTWKHTIKNHTCAPVPFPETVQLPNMMVNYHTLMIALIEKLRPNQPYVMLPEDSYDRTMSRKNSGAITSDNRNNPWNNFSRKFKELCIRAGVEQTEYRKLRTTLGTTTARHFNLTDTQKLLRHKSSQTTSKFYVVVNRKELVRRVNKATKNFYVTNET